jgi:nicotinamidase-related amidase
VGSPEMSDDGRAHRVSPHKHHRAAAEPEIGRRDTALLLIDIQYHGSHRDHGLLRARIDAGESEAIEYFANRVETSVVPAVRRLQAAFRDAGMEVIHVKTQSLTQDGRDRSLTAKLHGTHIPPGDREGDILDEIAPVGDEIVIAKSCPGVFNGTNIEYLLRNLGIATLVVGGVVTGSCVELAVRDAADRGFRVVLVEDATASWSQQMQDSAIEGMRDRSATVMTSDDVIARVGKQAVPA